MNTKREVRLGPLGTKKSASGLHYIPAPQGFTPPTTVCNASSREPL
jgi:hypothetical protein